MLSITFTFSELNITLAVLLITFGAIVLTIITFLAIDDILDIFVSDDSDDSDKPQDTE